jgi:chromosome segregation ATPase
LPLGASRSGGYKGHGTDYEREVAMTVKQSTATIEERFAAMGARLDRMISSVEHSKALDSLKKEMETWHGLIDEVKVQAALGSMETRDRVAEAMEALDRLARDLDQRLATIEESFELVPDFKDSIRSELERAREELSSPAAFES